MGFPAHFPARCIKCMGAIKKGDLISWKRGGGSKGQVWHEACGAAAPMPSEQIASVVKEETTMGVTDTSQLFNIQALAAAVSPFIKAGVDKDTLEAMIDAKLRAMPARVLEVKQEGKATVKIEGAHAMFERLLYVVGKRFNVFLWGPAGSGKSTGARMVAEALALPWGYISLNPQTSETKLMGFMHAGGEYVPTVFFDCYTKGGIFCIDEICNASPNLLTALNSLLENGHGAFPHGVFPRHKDFVLITTDNTNGRGGNAIHPDRRALDAAFLERFHYMEWGYDTNLERRNALAINPKAEPWIAWIEKAREFCASTHPRVLVTPRASFKGATLLLDKVLSVEEIVKAEVFKGVDEETQASILRHCPLPTIG